MKTKHALTFRKALCLLTAGILLSGCAMNSASSEPPKDSPAQHSGENFGQNPHHAEHDAVIPRRGAVKRENKQTVSNESDAMQVLEAQLPDMGLKGKAEDNFRVEMTDTNSVGKTYVMQQQYQGIDVYGATVLVPTDADSGNEYLIDGSVNGIAGDVVADLTEKQAQHMLTECSELGQTDFNVLSHGLVMYPDHAGDYRLCYSFGVTTVQEDGSRKEQNVFLDADSGELVGCDDTSVFSETIRHTSDSFTDVNGDPLQYHLTRDGDADYLRDPNTGIILIDAMYHDVNPNYVDADGNITDDPSKMRGFLFEHTIHWFRSDGFEWIGDPCFSRLTDDKYDVSRTTMEN